MPLPLPARLALTLSRGPPPQVYKPVGLRRTALWGVGGFILLACTAACVGSVEQLIVSWSTFTFFI